MKPTPSPFSPRNAPLPTPDKTPPTTKMYFFGLFLAIKKEKTLYRE
jgi:hypothetical protein